MAYYKHEKIINQPSVKFNIYVCVYMYGNCEKLCIEKTGRSFEIQYDK